jgi:S1-C subfamily serine protease
VVEIEGKTIDGASGLVAAIRDREPGDELEIIVFRGGDRLTLSVVLASRPET